MREEPGLTGGQIHALSPGSDPLAGHFARYRPCATAAPGKLLLCIVVTVAAVIVPLPLRVIPPWLMKTVEVVLLAARKVSTPAPSLRRMTLPSSVPA